MSPSVFNRFNFLSLLTILVLLRSVHVKSVDNKRTSDQLERCDSVRPFFEMKNISFHQHHRIHEPGPMCGGVCCSKTNELSLQKHIQRDFASLLEHNAGSFQGLLTTATHNLHGYMTELLGESENKTLRLFAQVYRRMAVFSRAPIHSLYNDMRKNLDISKLDTYNLYYLNLYYNKDVDGSTSDQTAPDLAVSIQKFFADLFPLVYHHEVNPGNVGDFSHEYKNCLKAAANEVKPFGDIPRQLSATVAKALEVTRVLLQASMISAKTLAATDTLVTTNDECHKALLKMTYCPRCHGMNENKPCSGYCLNVVRGCLTRPVTELDAPWNDYVEAMQRLAHRREAITAIQSLSTKVSEAIMYAMENGPAIETKIKQACGHPQLSDKENPLIVDMEEEIPTGGPKPHNRYTNGRSSTSDAHLLYFVSALTKSRGFYANLADNLCKDDSFAETRDSVECWNGERIGEYTKTVVDASLNMQKYNPEVFTSASVEAENFPVSHLADQLRHLRQLVISVLGSTGAPQSDSYMQGDSVEGSGYRQGEYEAYPDDDDITQGSGSGDGHRGDDTTGRGNERENTHQNKKSNKPVSDVSLNEIEASSSMVIIVSPIVTLLTILCVIV